jgi:hypothetical protein
LDFFLYVYVKAQVYCHRVNTLDELKARITAVTLNVTTDMLQRAWQEVVCGRDHCSKCKCYNGHVTARLARDGL